MTYMQHTSGSRHAIPTHQHNTIAKRTCVRPVRDYDVYVITRYTLPISVVHHVVWVLWCLPRLLALHQLVALRQVVALPRLVALHRVALRQLVDLPRLGSLPQLVAHCELVARLTLHMCVGCYEVLLKSLLFLGVAVLLLI